MKERHKTNVAVFVLMERDGKVVLLRRANTGYADGLYQMPSGHIEPNEYPLEAAVREAKEETGVTILPEDLEFIHVSYRINKEDETGDWVDFHFRTSKWEGEPMNAEPHKCDDLIWVSLDNLPGNTVPVVKEALTHITSTKTLSELGRP